MVWIWWNWCTVNKHVDVCLRSGISMQKIEVVAALVACFSAFSYSLSSRHGQVAIQIWKCKIGVKPPYTHKQSRLWRLRTILAFCFFPCDKKRLTEQTQWDQWGTNRCLQVCAGSWEGMDYWFKIEFTMNWEPNIQNVQNNPIKCNNVRFSVFTFASHLTIFTIWRRQALLCTQSFLNQNYLGVFGGNGNLELLAMKTRTKE